MSAARQWFVGGASALFLLLCPVVGQAGGTQGATVKVRVGQFRSTDGFLGYRLVFTPAAFPEGPGKEMRRSVQGERGVCTFTDLPAGTYAVSVMHDENGNGKLDKGVFGIPKEGYGVSNNKTYAMAAPKWSESKFSLGAGETKTLSIRLRY